MQIALYYPYLQIQSVELLKQALLFWDQIEIISISSSVQTPSSKDLRKATNLVVRAHKPTGEQQLEAHNQLLALVNQRLPPWFYLNAAPSRGRIIAQKFMSETWRELKARGLAQAQDIGEQNYWSSEYFGLLMMGILADCCAGQTKVTVTDKAEAYDAVGKCLAVELGAEARQARPDERVLTTADILSPSIDAIPLSNLIRLREQENGNHGNQYRQMRHKLFNTISEHSKKLANPEYNSADKMELNRQFKQNFEDDFMELRSELRLTGRSWIFSSEMGVMTTAIAGAFALGATGGLAGVPLALGASIPLVRKTDKYKSARFKALTGHFSSYVYLANQGRFERDV